MLREMFIVADTSKTIDDWGETSSGRRQKTTRSGWWLHFVAEPSSATRLGAAKTEILFLSDWLSKHVDGGGTCGKARIGADVPENFKSTLNDVVERNICKHARMNNLMRSGRTLINGCYHPAGSSGIS